MLHIRRRAGSVAPIGTRPLRRQEAAGAHRQGLQVVRISDRPKRAGQQLRFSESEQAAESRVDLKEPSLGTHERESDGSAVEGLAAARTIHTRPLPEALRLLRGMIGPLGGGLGPGILTPIDIGGPGRVGLALHSIEC